MGSSGEEGPKGSLMDVPPAALANLCVCYVISSQNEVAEDLLKRVEEETTAAQVSGKRSTAAANAELIVSVTAHYSYLHHGAVLCEALCVRMYI